jgi:uncharacterized membrane protein
MPASERLTSADPVTAPPADEERGWRSPPWAPVVTLIICVLGMAVASYLTYAHYTDPRNLACSDSGVINCARVTTSAQSHFLGMPVAVLGLAYFVGMAVLCSPWFWRRPEPVIRGLRVVGAVAGIAMILYLIYAELFIIDAICLYCTVVHVLTLLLFIAVCAATVVGTHRPAAVEDFDLLDEDDEDDELHPATDGSDAAAER